MQARTRQKPHAVANERKVSREGYRPPFAPSPFGNSGPFLNLKAAARSWGVPVPRGGRVRFVRTHVYPRIGGSAFVWWSLGWHQ